MVSRRVRADAGGRLGEKRGKRRIYGREMDVEYLRISMYTPRSQGVLYRAT